MGELADRMSAIATGLAAACPARVVTRHYADFAKRKPADLDKGILTLVSLGEDGYQNLRGRAAQDGRHNMILLAQIKLAEKSTGDQVEAAEFALVEEVKAFLRELPAGLACLEMTGFRQSGQQDAPFGWASMDLELKA